MASETAMEPPESVSVHEQALQQDRQQELQEEQHEREENQENLQPAGRKRSSEPSGSSCGQLPPTKRGRLAEDEVKHADSVCYLLHCQVDIFSHPHNDRSSASLRRDHAMRVQASPTHGSTAEAAAAADTPGAAAATGPISCDGAAAATAAGAGEVAAAAGDGDAAAVAGGGEAAAPASPKEVDQKGGSGGSSAADRQEQAALPDWCDRPLILREHLGDAEVSEGMSL